VTDTEVHKPTPQAEGVARTLVLLHPVGCCALQPPIHVQVSRFHHGVGRHWKGFPATAKTGEQQTASPNNQPTTTSFTAVAAHAFHSWFDAWLAAGTSPSKALN
jgi:hypothetical protein